MYWSIQVGRVCSLRENILQSNCMLPVQSYITHRCLHIKSCLKREIWPLHLDMLPCNPKIGVRFSHLVIWGSFLLPLCYMVLITCCIPPSHNIRILLLCVQLVLLAMLVVLVIYWEVSFSEHLHHMTVLALDMDDSVDFLASYDQIIAKLPLHIRSLICLHTFLYNSISLIYQV